MPRGARIEGRIRSDERIWRDECVWPHERIRWEHVRVHEGRIGAARVPSVNEACVAVVATRGREEEAGEQGGAAGVHGNTV